MDGLDEALEMVTIGGWGSMSPYFYAALFVIIGIIVAKLVGRSAERFVRQHRSSHAAVLTGKAVFYLTTVAIVLVTLSQLGVRLSGLLAAAGIFTVAIAFAAQTSVSNVISGLFLYFDRPFSIDDTVKVGEVLGTVTAIDLLSSRVRTFDNLMVRIPNETLLKSTITNYSLHAIRRIELPVGVAYGSDLKHVQKVLSDALALHPLILDEPAPVILFDALGDDGVELNVRVWIERTQVVKARSDLTRTIYDALNAEGIEIPWPQRVVHMKREPVDEEQEVPASTSTVQASDYASGDLV